jgi:hypothetical protein
MAQREIFNFASLSIFSAIIAMPKPSSSDIKTANCATVSARMMESNATPSNGKAAPRKKFGEDGGVRT